MIIGTQELKRTKRVCALIGCGNTFIGPPQQKYCDDPRCREARRILANKKKRSRVDNEADNLKLSKGKFPTGTILRIQCSATGLAGRCSKRFLVYYEAKRTVYPKYCEEHRNEYKRKRFEGRT